MIRWQLPVTVIVSIWIAAVLQSALAQHLSIFGCRPDFPLILLANFALILPRGAAALVGFACGFATGAIAGANLTHYIVSRTFAGFCLSWSKAIGIQLNLLFVGLATALTTIFAGILWMFLAAPHGLASFIGDTIGSALYNGVLAVPVYVLLRKILRLNARIGL